MRIGTYTNLVAQDKYNTTPLRQQEQDVSQMQFGSIWEKIQGYGPDMDKKIDKFIKHNNYSAETDKPINSFQNQEWVGTITKWLQEQKAATIRANKNNDEKQRISTAVNTLIQDVTTYSGKFLDWIARNAGDETEGNAGGSVVSQGSKKDERFIGNITFMVIWTRSSIANFLMFFSLADASNDMPAKPNHNCKN